MVRSGKWMCVSDPTDSDEDMPPAEHDSDWLTQDWLKNTLMSDVTIDWGHDIFS